MQEVSKSVKDIQPLLTIAIPTFNRVECLKLLINSIVKQTSENFLGRNFELLICNNASTDGTEEYLNDLESLTGIRVVNHTQNCGAVDNVLHCFDLAKGQFVWVMGDDDVPLMGAIKAVMECIECEQPALMYLPSKWVVGDLGELAKNRILTNKVSVTDSLTLAVRASVYVTFLSSWIVNKGLYLNQKNVKIDRYRDTFLPQLEWFFTLLANEKKFVYAEDSWVVARSGSSGGYSVLETFSHQYNRIVDDKFTDNPQLHRFFRTNMLWCFIPSLIWGMRKNAIGRFGGFDKEKTMILLKSAYQNEVFFGLVVVPMIKYNRPVAWFFRLLAAVSGKAWLFLHRKLVAGKL